MLVLLFNLVISLRPKNLHHETKSHFHHLPGDFLYPKRPLPRKPTKDLDTIIEEQENSDPASIAIPVIKFEEGFRSQPYYCSGGFPTIGYGHSCSTTKGASLSTCPSYISESAASDLLSKDINSKSSCIRSYSSILSAFNAADDRRAAILISMAYQMGCSGLNKFQNFLSAMARKDWSRAKVEMLDSSWARQTPNRAIRHAEVISSGKCSTYGWY